jgi:hypothetical protein
MSFIFEVNKTINALLFLISSLGGKINIGNLAAILYLADLKHLSKHGTLILGETYIAARHCPMPLNVFCIYMQLKGESNNRIIRYNLSEYFVVAEADIIALKDYDGEYLSENEVATFFETIQENKTLSTDDLLLKVQDKAWTEAGASGEMSLYLIAASSGATDEMMIYIEKNIENELHSFERKNNGKL